MCLRKTETSSTLYVARKTGKFPYRFYLKNTCNFNELSHILRNLHHLSFKTVHAPQCHMASHLSPSLRYLTPTQHPSSLLRDTALSHFTKSLVISAYSLHTLQNRPELPFLATFLERPSLVPSLPYRFT